MEAVTREGLKVTVEEAEARARENQQRKRRTGEDGERREGRTGEWKGSGERAGEEGVGIGGSEGWGR